MYFLFKIGLLFEISFFFFFFVFYSSFFRVINVQVMANLQFPIIECDGNKFQVAVDLQLYSKEAITASIYKYSNIYYISQQLKEGSNNVVIITFESKDKEVLVEKDIPKQFCNVLIDEQIRQNINAQFGKIRDRIVFEAFRPISK